MCIRTDAISPGALKEIRDDEGNYGEKGWLTVCRGESNKVRNC